MYWEVVEVRPEPGYCLFVRFKDGMTGNIRLRREELTGVLTPLADVSFFEQVFNDCGAVAWPGERSNLQMTLSLQMGSRRLPVPIRQVVESGFMGLDDYKVVLYRNERTAGSRRFPPSRAATP